MQLSNDEIRRYSRHLILPEVGLAGQKKIKAASVLCIGAGGLGSPIAMYLAAAGIGRIGIVDFDAVEQPRDITARSAQLLRLFVCLRDHRLQLCGRQIKFGTLNQFERIVEQSGERLAHHLLDLACRQSQASIA